MKRIRRPDIRLEFVTDENIFTLRYSNAVEVTGEQVGNKVLGFQTKNAMSDDSATFVITLAGDTNWDKALMINDIVKIYINPNPADDKEGLVLVGMISQVSKIGSYSNDQTTYRITGQAFSKPFIKFGLGVIQEVQAVLPATGWLVDGEKIKFSGSNASQIMKEVLDYFIPFMRYKYDDGKGNHNKTISDHFAWDGLDSWTAFENLKDTTQLTNFDGSLKQMMDMITAKPFNELFFRNGQDKNADKTQLVMRKTPFNESQWKALDYETVSSEDFVEEDVGKSDVETYSIFTVTTPQMLKTMEADVFSKPQYHKELVDRYGYSKLEVENMYIPIEENSSTEDDNNDAGDEQESYDKVMKDLKKEGKDKVSKAKNKWVKKLASKYKGLTKENAQEIVDKFSKDGKLSEEDYKKIIDKRDAGAQKGTYDKVLKDLKNQGQQEVNAKQEGWAKILSSRYHDLTKDQAKKLVAEFSKTGSISESKYKEVTGRSAESDQQIDNRPIATVPKLKEKLKKHFPDNKSFEGEDGKKNKKKAIDDLANNFRFGSKADAEKLVEKYMEYKGTPPDDQIYKDYIKALEEISNASADVGADATDSPMLIFSKMLYNWYYNNPNFYSGDIIVLGHHKYDLGKRLFVKDEQRNDVWEFYIESVEHKFDYKQGYYTTIGVTRGLKEAEVPDGSPVRFAPPWGQSSDFIGGLLGEKSLADMKSEAIAEKNKGKDGGGDDEGGDASGGESLKKLEKYKGDLPKWDKKTYPGNPQVGGLVGECTWYVYNRRKQFGLSCGAWGDAHNYDNAARAQGIGVGTTPKRGAILNWEAYKSGDHGTGHVAFVEGVSKDGKTIHISEYNYSAYHTYGERTLKVSSLPKGNYHFIY